VRCELCGREPIATTRHHLVPRTLSSRKSVRVRLPERIGETVDLCEPCHFHVHRTFTEKELAARFFTLESLLADERIIKWIQWIKDKPSGLSPRK
jgi:hypothetical protein